MRWVLKILRKHLDNERRWMQYESVAGGDAQIREGVRMAKERIPQLEQAIEILEEVKEAVVLPAEPPTSEPVKTKATSQLSLFSILRNRDE